MDKNSAKVVAFCKHFGYPVCQKGEAMRVITNQRLNDFAAKHPGAEAAIKQFIKRLEASRWKNLQDIRATFPHADLAEVDSGNKVLVFNVGGNDYRVIAAVPFPLQRVYILAVLTHAEYDKQKWKKTL
jgi:mRNA interferase HigB